MEYADDMAPVVALDALKSPRHESYSPRRAHSLSRSGSECSQSQKMSNYTVAFSLTVFSNLPVSLAISDQPYGVKDPIVRILSPPRRFGTFSSDWMHLSEQSNSRRCNVFSH